MKKKIPEYLLLAGLGLAFLAVCILLVFFKKKQGLIKAKLKIGALIISLTAITQTGCVPPVITCYEPVPQDYISLDNAEYNYDFNFNELTLDPVVSGRITGRLSGATGSGYSFRIEDPDNREIIRGEILPLDGAFDSSSEDIAIDVPATMETGSYYLLLFSGTAADQGTELNEAGMYKNALTKYILNISAE